MAQPLALVKCYANHSQCIIRYTARYIALGVISSRVPIRIMALVVPLNCPCKVVHKYIINKNLKNAQLCLVFADLDTYNI